jgi:lipopolysaccharide export system protein LptA
MSSIKTLFRSALLVSISLLSVTASALPSDQAQPIHIKSDSAHSNQKQGLTTYSGSVQMDQGSLQILADKVTIKSLDNKVSEIVAVGKPAQYQQQPSPESEIVTATGERIVYLVDKETLTLSENASLNQNGTIMTGKHIDYDIKQSVVRAAKGNEDTSSDRIHIIIPAKP